MAPFNSADYRMIETIDEDRPGEWPVRQSSRSGGDQGVPGAVVHGDASNPAIADIVAGLAEESEAFLVGGLTALRAGAQIADRVTGGGLWAWCWRPASA